MKMHLNVLFTTVKLEYLGNILSCVPEDSCLGQNI